MCRYQRRDDGSYGYKLVSSRFGSQSTSGHGVPGGVPALDARQIFAQEGTVGGSVAGYRGGGATQGSFHSTQRSW